MGLDGVEMVMKLEEAFDISIADAEAERCRTPRDVIELVMGKVGRTDVAVCVTQRAFHRIRRALMNELGLKRTAVRLEEKLDRLLPGPPKRTAALEKISNQLGASIALELERSKLIATTIILSSLAAAVAVGFCVAHLPTTNSVWVNFAASLSPLTGIGAFVCALKIGFWATQHLRTEFPTKLSTVRDLSRWLVAKNPKLLGTPPGQWSRGQVAEIVRNIVIDVLGLSEDQYNERSRFVEDLGMG